MPMPSSASLPFAAGDGQAALDLVPQPQRVPIKGVEHADRRIGEAVQFFDCQPAGGPVCPAWRVRFPRPGRKPDNVA